MSHLKRGERPGTPQKPRINKIGTEVVDVICSRNPKHTGEVMLAYWPGDAKIVCHPHTPPPPPKPGEHAIIVKPCTKKDECLGTYSQMKVKVKR